ncbi:MAG: hydrogenase maturation protease [Deltaproteobacteria bacterium]|nr:hydrogenase maturation protease [Deltaproteobacteria bacterium]
MGMTTSTKKRPPRILIAGLGNLLLQDDGVGVHAVRELQQDPPPGVLVAEVGTQVLAALHLLEWADRILALDAMQAGQAPGTIYAFGVDDVAEPEIQASLHELGLRAVLRMLPEPTQVEIAVLGVEPEVIDYGLELSPPVAGALPRLTAAAREMVRRWQEK